MTNLKRNTVLLTGSGMVEFGLQFLIPIIFVRHLDPNAFGQYRLLWLVAGTALALAPAFMPQSLFYFLPRTSRDQRAVPIGNVIAYLSVAGLGVALCTSKWNPLLPENIANLFILSGGISSVFLGLWIVVSIMTVLPIAEERITWQVRSDISLSLLRTVLLATAAIMTQQLIWVLTALLIEAVARIGTLILYLHSSTVTRLRINWKTMRTQLRYALPFAAGNALFQLRSVADQWIIASILSPSLFGLFSISSVFLSLTALIRQPVCNAIMPRLTRSYASGDLDDFVCLFRKSCVVTTLLLVMLGGTLLCVTRELVEIVYTERYSKAVPVMHIYLITMMVQGCSAGYLLPVLNRAGFAVFNNLTCLTISAVSSYVGTLIWGLPGAACGGLIAFAISELWSLNVIARALQVSLYDLVPWMSLLKFAFACVFGFLIVALTMDELQSSPFIQLTIKSAVYLTAFITLILIIDGSPDISLLRRTSTNQS